MSGLDIITVQELMGHKSISMTKRYYDSTPEHKEEQMKWLILDIAMILKPIL